MQAEHEVEKKRAPEEALEDDRAQKRVKCNDDDKDEVVWPTGSILGASLEQCQQEMRAWIDACDPKLLGAKRQEVKGEFTMGTQEAGEYIIANHSKNCRERYELVSATATDTDTAIDRAQLARDVALCQGICSVHTLHTIARLWFDSCQRDFTTAVLSVLFHCLRHHLELHRDADQRRLPLLVRLMELGSCHFLDGKLMTTVPTRAKGLLAAMHYKNIALVRRNDAHLVKTLGVSLDEAAAMSEYRITCREFLSDEYGFCDLLRGHFFPAEHTPIGDDPLQPVALKARDKIVDAVDRWMVNRKYIGAENTVPRDTLFIVLKRVYAPVDEREYLQRK
jgi:hypothetical protein